MGYFPVRINLKHFSASLSDHPSVVGLANGEVILRILAATGQYLRQNPQQLLPFCEALMVRAGQDAAKGTYHGMRKPKEDVDGRPSAATGPAVSRSRAA